MADDKDKKDEKVEVPMSALTKMQEQMAEMERKLVEVESKNAGLEEQFLNKPSTEAKNELRTKKDFEPKFRTVRIRKYPIAGDVTNLGYVVGWTNRGAYQKVDRSGVSPQIVDFIDIIFLGRERDKDGKLQVEEVKLLDLFNNGIQVHCKIIKIDRKEVAVPTNEEIDISVYDPTHGLVQTGEKIDGFVTYSDLKYTVQIPGVEGEHVIDALFLN